MRFFLLLCIFFIFLLPQESEARFGGGHSFRSKSRSRTSSHRSNHHTSGFTYRNSGGSGVARNLIPIVPTVCLLLSAYCFSILIRNKTLDTFLNTIGGAFGFLVFGVGALFLVEKVWMFINLVLTFGGIVLMYLYMYRQKGNDEPEMLVSQPNANYYRQKVQMVDYNLEKFFSSDVAFSKVLFLDFVQKLYHQFYQLQNTPQFQHLSPFFETKIMQPYLQSSKETRRHSEIVIGNIQLIEIGADETEEEFTVELTTNYTETFQQNQRRMRSVEQWVMARKKGIISPEPQKMQAICCPNCGASSSFNSVGECGYCKTVVRNGALQWYVKRKTTTNTEAFDTDLKGHYEEEQGTDLPTIFHPNLRQQKEKFCRLHEVEDYNVYASFFDKNIVIPVFQETYKAWSEKRLYKVRHLLTDALYETQLFWMNEYLKKGYSNHLKNMQIQSIETVKIEFDAYYEAITVRIFASCFDYLTDKKNNWVAGSHTQARHFSEYWTFIRRKKVGKEELTPNSHLLDSCPNCGANIEHIGATAVCECCKSKLSHGDFSYILATITQDEVYVG
ncbi:MAG: TIM44-like domain-containing protein [Bacteroidia bacterium]